VAGRVPGCQADWSGRGVRGEADLHVHDRRKWPRGSRRVPHRPPDGSKVFKVLDVGKYDDKLRRARNPEQNLAEGEYY
jgi:hypothetical protein